MPIRLRLASTFSNNVFGGVLVFVVVLGFVGYNVNCQTCQRTSAQPDYTHACPYYSREAYTIETLSSSGRHLYEKECCDEKGVVWNQAAVNGCQSTRCLPYRVSQPCTSLPRYIINGQYVRYDDVKRDRCMDPRGSGQYGQIAVCCPPNSQSSWLITAYGAEANEFPHQARLETDDEVCAGTVYNHNTVITAAHCVVDKQGNFKDARKFKLILGTNIASYSGRKNEYTVEKYIVHPGYSLHRSHGEFNNWFRNKRTYNDIALLRLARSIDFSKIRALRLAPENFEPGRYASHVTIVGWGTADNGVTSDYLQKANLLVRSDNQCFKSVLGGLPYPNTQELAEQFHCFGGILNGKASPVAGRGDSGGPAICRGPDGYAVLCGVASFGGDGDECRRNVDETSCKPSVYADVSYFRDWIRNNAGEQDVKIASIEGPKCGGTLISRDTVVTAAHCVFTANGEWRRGIQFLAWGGSRYEPRNGGILVPNGFASYETLAGLKSSSFQGYTWIDNVAVIKLNGMVPIPNNALPSLANGRFPTEYAMELAWPMGRRNQDNYLVQRYFRVLQTSECQKRLEMLGIIGVRTSLHETDKYFCGVEDYSGGGVCERYLGGGVICPGGNGAGTLCGVQTFRFCDMSLPTVFLNLANYSNMLRRGVNA